MKSVNSVTLLGHVTRDPESKATANGGIICTFGLATNRVWKDKEGMRQSVPEFHSIVCFGRLAELCVNYVRAGKPLYVEGSLKTRSWEADGAKHFRTEVVAQDITLLGAKEQEASVEYPKGMKDEVEEVEEVA
jgi:single-strand DNA-binding protein